MPTPRRYNLRGVGIFTLNYGGGAPELWCDLRDHFSAGYVPATVTVAPSQSTTEFAVTDHRVIYKRGFLRRHTVEMNMDKVETVDVDQSVLGRLLGFGTIHVHGTGQGIENLSRVAAPLRLRNAITAR